MRFAKIKYSAKDHEVSLSWSEERANGDTFAHNLTSPDAPRPEFLEALRGLASYARRICETGAWGEGLRPIGISLSVSKEGARGCVITCLRNVSIVAAPLVLNTPHVAEDAWPGGLGHAIEELEEEATRYVRGDRAQGNLFDKASDKTSDIAGKVTGAVMDTLRNATSQPEDDDGEEDDTSVTISSTSGGDPVTLTGKQFSRVARGAGSKK